MSVTTAPIPSTLPADSKPSQESGGYRCCGDAHLPAPKGPLLRCLQSRLAPWRLDSPFRCIPVAGIRELSCTAVRPGPLGGESVNLIYGKELIYRANRIEGLTGTGSADNCHRAAVFRPAAAQALAPAPPVSSSSTRARSSSTADRHTLPCPPVGSGQERGGAVRPGLPG